MNDDVATAIERLKANSGSDRQTQFWADVRILIAALEGDEKIVAEYLDLYGQGYVITQKAEGFQFVWREAGEEDDPSHETFATMQGAIRAAWQDWLLSGSSPYLFFWCRILESDAKEA